jgi:hypothetical protein
MPSRNPGLVKNHRLSIHRRLRPIRHAFIGKTAIQSHQLVLTQKIEARQIIAMARPPPQNAHHLKT